MNRLRIIPGVVLLVFAMCGSAAGSQGIPLSENAALRYWSAFAQMQDSAITDDQAKKLKLILDGTAPYDDLTYRALVEINRPALETMIRGTAFPNCDWSIDYQLGSDAPVDYVRRALELGRLNVLYAFHLLLAGDKDGAVRVLSAGLRFSRDIANGGTLFSALVAKNLIASHLSAIEFAVHVAGLSAAQKAALQKTLAQLGPEGVDWQAAVRRELAIFQSPFRTSEGVKGLDSHGSAALAEIVQTCVAALDNPSLVPSLRDKIASAPQPLPKVIPNLPRVVEQRQNLADKIMKTQALLR